MSSNPIINVSKHNHFSSDASVAQIADSNGNKVLALVSSRDLEKNVDPTITPREWAMDSTFLYTTSGSVVGDTTVKWYEHGSILEESDFPWANHSSHHMWAPDIQHFPSDSNAARQIWLYVPDIDRGGTQRIGMAHSDVITGLYSNSGFGVEPNFFQLQPGPGGNPLSVNTRTPGFAFDPGIFFDDAPGRNKYFMTYVNTSWGTGDVGNNLSMVAVNADRKGGAYLGTIKFTGTMSDAPLKDYTGLNWYKEGPDIFKLSTPGTNPRTYYYLVFATHVGNISSNDDTGHIGYAMCTPQEFVISPTRCWRFKGWIFGAQRTGRSNHASLIQIQQVGANSPDRYYVFFHRVMPGFDETDSSRSRQLNAKEIEIKDHLGFDDDGEIIGVTHPTDANKEVRTLYGTLDGRTRSIAKGFINIQDDSIGSSTESKITLSSFRNVTAKILDNDSSKFQLHYYVTVEPGQNLYVDPINQGNARFTLASAPIKHISLNTWAVVMNYVGTNPIYPLTDLQGVNAQFALHYDSAWDESGKSYKPFGKLDDFSQPIGSYPTYTTRVAMLNHSGDLLAGEKPDLYETPTALRSMHRDNNNRHTYLTPSTSMQHDGINNQYLKDGWDQQQWIEEPVTNFNGLNEAIPEHHRSRAVRLKNKWNNFYMTCNDEKKIGSDGQPYFLLLQQALRWNWETQIWIKEDVGNQVFRYRSAFTKGGSAPLYLTLNNGNNGDTGWQHVYVQPDHRDWDTQKWVNESLEYKVLRADHIDKNSQLTYLTAATTNVDQGINNQYLQTGSDLQKWIIEPVTDFKGLSIAASDQRFAIRLRNKQTGYYATTNNSERIGDDKKPYFLLLDQALRSDWTSQVWIRKNFENGSSELRNAWKPTAASPSLLLTLNPGNNGDKGTQDVYLRSAGDSVNGIPSLETQRWIIE